MKTMHKKQFKISSLFFILLCLSVIIFSAFKCRKIDIDNRTNTLSHQTNQGMDSTMLSQPAFEIIVEENVPIPMSDSTILRADVYKPSIEGQYPVLVGRVAYKLRDWPGDMYTITGEYYARRGYVVVWQNVRGTFVL